MDKNTAKVSIILPIYNGARFAQESISSCLNQTYKDIELIIVDDGSTDDTYATIKSFNDRRILYLKHEKNKGLPYALNTGFAHATGEYLTWTSVDNYYKPQAVKRMIMFLDGNNCEFVYSDYYKFHNEMPDKTDEVILPDAGFLNTVNMIGPCFLYKRQVMETIGDYDVDTELAEDYDYWIRISKKFSMCHLNESLYFYREHQESLYVSQYFTVKTVDCLVRLKNNIADVPQVTGLFINLIALRKIERSYFNHIRILKKYAFKMEQILIKLIHSKKVESILRDYMIEKISFKMAVQELVKFIV